MYLQEKDNEEEKEKEKNGQSGKIEDDNGSDVMEGQQEQSQEQSQEQQQSQKEEKEKLIVIRSNWEGYLKEFKIAVDTWGFTGGNYEEFRKLMMMRGEDDDIDDIDDDWETRSPAVEWEMVGPELLKFDGGGGGGSVALTNFEAKYIECGEPVYELSVLGTSDR